jgi:cytochrome c oxidase cbb3-type subunit 1
MLTPAQSPQDAQTDASTRLPLFVLFVSAAIWLILTSVFGLLSSLKFHHASFLADCAWLTYGRIRPAFTNSFLYGFCVQAGLGVMLWGIARFGQVSLTKPVVATVAAALWNLGVTIGILGILAGDATGFENFDMPGYADVLLFVSYTVLAVLALQTFHLRRERAVLIPHWFFLSAAFWFTWIFSTAALLLLAFPVRGVAQAVIAWWYSNNLQMVWLTLVGLGTAFTFLPKLLNRGADTALAMFTFWFLLFFAPWGGIPNSAPVPSWMPSLSTAATLFLLIPFLSLVLALRRTAGPQLRSLLPVGPWDESAAPLKFIGIGVLALLLSLLANIFSSLFLVSKITDFTWFIPAKNLLQSYGFFAMVMFGALYYILPLLAAGQAFCPKLIRAHFWLAVVGIALYVVPLGIGGIVQGYQLRDASIPFLTVAKSSLMFLRISTLGDLALLAGHCVFAANVIGLVRRFAASKAAVAYAEVTAEIKPAGVQP